ncbi:unnamed protein product [Phyllotreta striolata]|uniref:Major facilitator superfamily (MFS) profile domain-containing protein n=1 Tax=Phyllotreta striolata TaxID=444603 RepID=A0A9N9TQG5_PHYSR|nr:unnamed protein product [Phyllotreta striolata]
MTESDCEELSKKSSEQNNCLEENNLQKRDGNDGFHWMLYFSAFTANILLFNVGVNTVWFSPMLPKLLSNDTNINPLGRPIQTSDISILATIGPIFGVIGLLPAAGLADLIGRKSVLLLIAFISACNALMTSFAYNVYFYYVKGVLAGLCISASLVIVPVYMNEIAEDRNRGKLGGFMGMAIPTGVLMGYVVGPITSARTFPLFYMAPSIIHLILSLFTVESPTYLALKQRQADCARVLGKLRNTTDAKKIETECNKIEFFIATSIRRQRRSFLDVFRHQTARRAFSMCMVASSVQQLSGIFVILAFMSSIFSKSGRVSGDTFGIITGVIQLCTFFVSSVLVDKIGRRPLLLTSSLVCSLALFVMGYYINLQNSDDMVWLAILGIVLFVVGYGIGLGPIPITLCGELFPDDLRAMGCGIVLVADNSAICFIMFCFPLASAYFGVQYCMWFFSLSCLIGLVGIYLVVPETKGKSFNEIQAILSR